MSRRLGLGLSGREFCRGSRTLLGFWFWRYLDGDVSHVLRLRLLPRRLWRRLLLRLRRRLLEVLRLLELRRIRGVCFCVLWLRSGRVLGSLLHDLMLLLRPLGHVSLLDTLCSLWPFPHHLYFNGGMAPHVRREVNGRPVAMLGKRSRRGSFSERLRRGGVAGPVLCLNAMEGLLMLGVGNALSVHRRVHMRRSLAPSALVDHWDGDITGL